MRASAIRFGVAVALAAATAWPVAAQHSKQPDTAVPVLPESIARSYVRDLAVKRALPVADPRQSVQANPAMLDEIVIYGQVDPEDFVRRRSKFLALRDRLDAERPSTPKEKAQALFCLIGLCGIYGPDGLPVEPKIADRAERRTLATTTQLNSMFRGTLQ